MLLAENTKTEASECRSWRKFKMGMSTNIMIGIEFELSDNLLNYFIRYHDLEWESVFQEQYQEINWETEKWGKTLYCRTYGGNFHVYCYADKDEGCVTINWINKMAKKLDAWGSTLAKKYKSKHRVILFPDVSF